MIDIVEYKSGWRAEYADIAGQLQRLAHGNVVRIDHIGSTSVPALAAKDFIEG
jgi:dephospho-CoA kinase